jgi:hypothetical protein
MCLLCSAAYSVGGVGLLLINGGTPLVLAATTSSSKPTISSQIQSLQELPSVVGSIKAPNLEEPTWLKEQNAAEAAAKNTIRTTPVTKVVTYDVTSKGAVTANMAEFRAQANATLNDGRGWNRLGISFQEVDSGGMFTLVMSEADQIPSFSSGCGTEYSCRAGRYVIINQDRWLGATSSWNSAGGSLRDYRHMVVNHETGHWLGHDHELCGGPGQPAPVMQQQSIDLQGCSFNPWPTADELWSTQLGIKKS